jgi:hypothetical protein
MGHAHLNTTKTYDKRSDKEKTIAGKALPLWSIFFTSKRIGGSESRADGPYLPCVLRDIPLYNLFEYRQSRDSSSVVSIIGITPLVVLGRGVSAGKK